MPVRYVIKDMPPQIDSALIQRLAQVDTATIGHVRTYGFMQPSILPLFPDSRCAGTAVTLALPGPDATLLHHAMSLLRPGDVLVIDRCGDTRFACWGGVINQAAKAIRLAAVVIDGSITDPVELREQGFPIWHKGVSAVTTQAVTLGGLMNVPVACGGVAVLPGDAIVPMGRVSWSCGPMKWPRSRNSASRARNASPTSFAAFLPASRLPMYPARAHASPQLTELSGFASLFGLSRSVTLWFFWVRGARIAQNAL